MFFTRCAHGLCDKLGKLRADSATSPCPSFVPTDAVFNNFRLITAATELRKLLTTCNLKSCELGPLPPFVMVDVLDEIVPFLLYLFNRHLLGVFFHHIKSALLSSLL